MSLPPIYPDLTPKIVDPAWLDIDKPIDLNQELKNQELIYQSQMEIIGHKNKDIIPIGMTTVDQTSEEDDDANDDDYDDDDNDDDEEEEDDSEMNDEYPDPMNSINL